MMGGAINVRLKNFIFGKITLPILPPCDPAHPVLYLKK